MAIRFACAQCGKHFRVPDKYAGRRGTCGRCGLKFVAPGLPLCSPAVSVPAGITADDDIPLTARSDGGGDRSWGAILIGLLAGALMISLLFQFRDGIVSSAPALAPLMPPKAEPAPRVQAGGPKVGGGIGLDPDVAITVAKSFALISYLFLLFVFPLVLPPVLSRKRVLSLGRWLIMAGLFFFMASAGFAFFEGFRMGAEAGGAAHLKNLIGYAGLYVCVFSFFGIPGCLLAAAVYPKDLPKP